MYDFPRDVFVLQVMGVTARGSEPFNYDPANLDHELNNDPRRISLGTPRYRNLAYRCAYVYTSRFSDWRTNHAGQSQYTLTARHIRNEGQGDAIALHLRLHIYLYMYKDTHSYIYGYSKERHTRCRSALSCVPKHKRVASSAESRRSKLRHNRSGTHAQRRSPI